MQCLHYPYGLRKFHSTMKKYTAEILFKPSSDIGLRCLSEFIVFSIYYENCEIMALQVTSYGKSHDWKKPPKSPLSGGLAIFLFKKRLLQFKWSLGH